MKARVTLDIIIDDEEIHALKVAGDLTYFDDDGNFLHPKELEADDIQDMIEGGLATIDAIKDSTVLIEAVIPDDDDEPDEEEG